MLAKKVKGVTYSTWERFPDEMDTPSSTKMLLELNKLIANKDAVPLVANLQFIFAEMKTIILAEHSSSSKPK
jgi:hypothetical protein